MQNLNMTTPSRHRIRRVSAPMLQVFLSILICLIGAGGVALVEWFQPYRVEGNLFDGTIYTCCGTPPPSAPNSLLDEGLIHLELTFVAMSICTALIALRWKSDRNQKIAFLVGFGLELLYLGWTFDWSPTGDQILPTVIWYPLDFMALVLLGVVMIMGIKPRKAEA